MNQTRRVPAVFAVAGVFLAVFVAVMVIAPGHYATVVLSDVGTVFAVTSAAVCCALAARRAAGRSRWGWGLLAGSVGAFAVGEALWTFYELVLHTDPFPSPADASFVIGIPVGVVGLLLLPGRPSQGLRDLLDGAIVAASLLFVSWGLVMGPAWRAGIGDAAGVLGLVYPAGDVVLACIALGALYRAPKGFRGSVALVGSGMLMMAIVDSGFAWLEAHDAYVSGSLVDSGWLAAYLLLGLGGWRAVRGRTTGEEATESSVPGVLASVLPYIPLLAALAVGVFRARSGSEPFLVVDGILILVLVLSRQFVGAWDNRCLAARLALSLAEVREREEALAHQALHDPLTGLPNRRLFFDRLGVALARAARHGQVSVAFLDLDGFKQVNDTAGHQAGDELLSSVAERLRGCIRASDTLARLGGDEFALLIDDLDGRSAERVAARLLEAMQTPFLIHGRELTVGASVGVAVATAGVTADELVGDADAAMYRSKGAGKGRVTMAPPRPPRFRLVLSSQTG